VYDLRGTGVEMRRTPLRSRYRPLHKRTRDQVFERDGYACYTCGTGAHLVVNHRYGGHNRPAGLDALTTACWFHNGTYETDPYARRLAQVSGLRLRRWQRSTTPVVNWLGQRFVLAADGSRSPATEEALP
jgi:hypothetical protein